MAIPPEELLELDLQELATYQRFNRLGSFPEIVFAIGGGGGGGGTTGGTTGGGDASAANQTIEITRLTSIRDRLPVALTAGGALRVDSSGVIQPVSGNINIGNFPATQQVAGSISIGNFPATQQIAGSVSIGNFPVTQQVQVNNFPATQSTAPGKTVDAALITEPALIAPGSTTAQSASGYSKLTYQIDATGITNDVLRMEGSLTGTGFVNLSDTSGDRTITTPGTYLFTFEGKLSFVRMTLVSIAGTAPSVTAHLLRGN